MPEYINKENHMHLFDAEAWGIICHFKKKTHTHQHLLRTRVSIPRSEQHAAT
jgi:hypothetical protein